MRATLLIALSVLCGCTSTASRPTRLSSERRSASLCWWRDSGWGDGVLLARHSVKALGRVRSLEGAQVMATATLRTGGSVPVLEGTWTGPGLVLEGDVDVGTVPAIASWEPRRIGAVGLLQKGARVRVLDATVGSVLAVPGEESLEVFRADEPLAVTLLCEDLSLRGVSDSPSQQVRAAGFSDDTPLALLAPTAALAPTVDAEAVGVLDGSKLSGLYELERRDTQVRVAAPTRDNITWIGWVDAALVKAATPEAATSPESTPPSTDAWRACREALPLASVVDGALRRVGTLQERAEFAVASDTFDPQWVEVRLALRWFEPSSKLYVPRAAASCAPSNRL